MNWQSHNPQHLRSHRLSLLPIVRVDEHGRAWTWTRIVGEAVLAASWFVVFGLAVMW